MRHRSPCIDIADFVRYSGDLALLSQVCEAFLEQLPPWRLAFDEASGAGDRFALGKLLHKMKGSCYAVSAHGVARTLEEAEQTLTTDFLDGWASKAAGLDAFMSRMELEMGPLTRRLENSAVS